MAAGALTSTGGLPTLVTIYWGAADGGTNAAAWGNTNLLGVLPTGLFSNQVSGIDSNAMYYYRCYATNSAGEGWAAETTNFLAMMRHQITATAGANGSISPSGVLSLVYGSAADYTITPQLYYRIQDVTVDGSSVGPTANYSFTNVIDDHSISASFVLDTVTGMDFIVGMIALDPTNPAYGGTFTAKITVRNRGLKSGNAGTLYVYTNKTTNVAMKAAATKTASVGTLGACSNKTITLTGIKSPGEGTNTFRAFIDATGATRETVETNNQLALKYIVIRKPDLIPTSITLDPITPSTGYVFNAVVVTKNQGLATAKNFCISVWASRSAIATNGIGENAWTNIVSLGVGQVVTNTFYGLSAGTGKVLRTLRVFVDSTNCVDERSETNNQLTKTYTPSAHPDFIVTAIRLVPGAPVYGQTFTANVTVKNQGQISSSGGSLYVYTNKPNPVAAGTMPTKSVSAGTLAVGASKTYTITGLSAGTDGTKTFRAYVDGAGSVVEVDENNNQMATNYTVVRKPDLVVSVLTLDPTTPARGGVFTGTVAIKNQGSTNSTASHVSLVA